MSKETPPISELLELAAKGDRTAEERAFTAVYGELRRLAAAQRARLRPGDTLDTTAVVHEAYMKLMKREGESWNGRHHFYCAAARFMKGILVDEARRKSSQKRGGDRQRIDLDDIAASVAEAPENLIALDDALAKLEREDPTDFQLVMLRYFTGLTVEETGDVLGLSKRTVERRWRFCRSWLARELGTIESTR